MLGDGAVERVRQTAGQKEKEKKKAARKESEDAVDGQPHDDNERTGRGRRLIPEEESEGYDRPAPAPPPPACTGLAPNASFSIAAPHLDEYNNGMGSGMRIAYWIFLASLLVAGMVLIGRSRHYPWYGGDISGFSMRIHDLPEEERNHEWFSGKRALETPRKRLNDTGIGLIALAVTLTAFRLLYGFPLRQAKTPKRRRYFLLLYLLVLLLQLPLSIWYYDHRLERYEYPPWADSIAIPIMLKGMGVLVVFGCFGGLVWISLLRKARLPAPLFAWPPGQRFFNVVVTLLCALMAALSLAVATVNVNDGDPAAILLGVTFAYLFLALRAGAVMRRAEGAQAKAPDEPGSGPRQRRRSGFIGDANV